MKQTTTVRQRAVLTRVTVVLKFVSYNIHRCWGVDGVHSPERVLQVLKEIDADVIALQEVESTRDETFCTLMEFARELGMYVVSGATMENEDTRYGNALLSRYPVEDVQRLDLSVQQREPRGAILATLRCGDRAVKVVATHLGLRPYERRAQVKQLLAAMVPDDPLPLVLLGDLNEWFLWGRPMTWLRQYFSHTPARRSFPSRWPLLPLDRVWLRPRTSLKSVRVHKTRLSRVASDHLPLVAMIAADEG